MLGKRTTQRALVIVAEGHSYSRMIDPGQLTSELWATSFDRLLLIDLWGPNIFSLTTSSVPAPLISTAGSTAAPLAGRTQG